MIPDYVYSIRGRDSQPTTFRLFNRSSYEALPHGYPESRTVRYKLLCVCTSWQEADEVCATTKHWAFWSYVDRVWAVYYRPKRIKFWDWLLRRWK